MPAFGTLRICWVPPSCTPAKAASHNVHATRRYKSWLSSRPFHFTSRSGQSLVSALRSVWRAKACITSCSSPAPFMSCVGACTCDSAHVLSAFARTTAFLHGRPGFPPAPGSALRPARLLVQSLAHTMLHTTSWNAVDALPPPSTCTFAEVLNCSQGVSRFPNASVCSVGARVVRFSALDCGMLDNHLHAVSLSKVPVGATAVSQVARVRVRVLSRTTRLLHPNTSATPPPTHDHFALSLRFAHQSLFSRHMTGQGQNTHLLVVKNKKTLLHVAREHPRV